MNSDHIVDESHQSLWLLIFPPAIWMVHFLFSYIAAAIWCGVVAGRSADLGLVRTAIVGTAVVALIGIGVTGRVGWRRYMHGDVESLGKDRYRFLGFATALISGLSAVAIIYTTLVTLLIRSCS